MSDKKQREYGIEFVRDVLSATTDTFSVVGISGSAFIFLAGDEKNELSGKRINETVREPLTRIFS